MSARPDTDNRPASPKVAFFVNEDFAAWLFWRHLFSQLLARGARVTVVVPNGTYVGRLRALGVDVLTVPLHRFMSPVTDLRLLRALIGAFRRERFDTVCLATIKPIVFGSIAAKLSGVPRIVAMFEGLGYVFAPSESAGARAQYAVARVLLRIACRLLDRAGFANPDDREEMVERGYVTSLRALTFRSMIGVSTHELRPDLVVDERAIRASIGAEPGAPVVAMVVARVVWSKGVREFVEASRLVAQDIASVRFVLVGPLEPDAPDAVPQEYLEQAIGPNFLWQGFRSDVRDVMAVASIVTLPSYYREGLPRVLLEGMALGKPLVAADSVGSREAVESGRNGELVPPRDSGALADAVRRILRDPALARAYGQCSRAKAVEEFDETRIAKRVMRELFGLEDAVAPHSPRGTTAQTA